MVRTRKRQIQTMKNHEKRIKKSSGHEKIMVWNEDMVEQTIASIKYRRGEGFLPVRSVL